MNKSSTPPLITPSALPYRLRNDSWWLVDDRQPDGNPPDRRPATMLIVIEGGVRERTSSAND
ncbi:hypothetical protein F4V88_23830 [Neorhizobium galegae]|nr:hypothetical protein F4V88_23830 [Neorhizobium galegae]